MKQKILTVGITALIVIVFGGLLSGCTQQPPLTPSGDNVVITEGLDNVVDANNRFALDLYSKYKSEEGNVFFSPYSISTALAMTYEGARGQTAQEMQSVFYFIICLIFHPSIYYYPRFFSILFKIKICYFTIIVLPD